MSKYIRKGDFIFIFSLFFVALFFLSFGDGLTTSGIVFDGILVALFFGAPSLVITMLIRYLIDRIELSRIRRENIRKIVESRRYKPEVIKEVTKNEENIKENDKNVKHYLIKNKMVYRGMRIINPEDEVNEALKHELLCNLTYYLEEMLLNKMVEEDNIYYDIEDDEEDDEWLLEDEMKKIDRMDGIEFEEYIADLLETIGFDDTEVTPPSNDYGADVIAEKDGVKYAIQCKRYESKLNNSPVQEIIGGKKYYKCHVGVVVTNSTFTENARNLAEASGILLWDRDTLMEMVEDKLSIEEHKNSTW